MQTVFARASFVAIAFLLPLMPSVVLSAEYVLRPSATSWRTPGSYEQDGIPPENSDIVIPEGMTINLSSAEDYGFLNKMSSVKPKKNSRLVAYVDEGKISELQCAVYVTSDKENADVGTLVKEGAGVLNLASPGRIVHTWGELADCNVNIEVNAGTLAPFKGIDKNSNFRFFKRVNVSEGAVLELPPKGTCEVWMLEGNGVVTNASDTVVQLSITSRNSGRSKFYGKLGGKINVNITGGMYLYSTDSSFAGSALVSGYKGAAASTYGYIGIMSFGSANSPSSFGTSEVFSFSAGPGTGSAYVEYLGEGETVGKMFGLKSTDKGPFTLDAGHHGGLVFTASWWNYAKNSDNVGEDVAIVLCGSNEVNACTVGSGIFRVADGTRDNIIKRGSGIWKFTQTGTASNLGSIGVEDGTLSFDTIDNSGLYSSLGSAESTRGASFCGVGAGVANLPYAYELGGFGGTPVLEYVGSTPGYSYDRHIALMGGVAHLRSSGEGPLKMRGAWMPVEGSATLVLDGANDSENVFSSISNGLGTVSVVKDGTGTWTLSGAQDFSGTLEVKQGTLKLNNKRVYEWYRILFKESYGTAANEAVRNAIQCKGFALYDANGCRIGTNLLHVTDYRTVQPGQSAYGTTKGIAQSATKPWQTTTTWLSSAKEWYTYEENGTAKDDYTGWCVKNADNQNFNKDDPHSWLPVVMRLTNGSPEAVGCDIAQKYCPANDDWARSTAVNSFELQGSTDGLDWRTLVDVDDCATTTAADRWAKTDTPTWTKQMRKLDDVETQSFYFGNAKSTSASTFLSNVSELKVARGARLEVAEGEVELPSGITLSIDCVGSGTACISNLTFPNAGVLKVAGQMDGELELPVQFAGNESYSNISGWSVRLNGKLFRGAVVCRGGKVVLKRKGMYITIH